MTYTNLMSRLLIIIITTMMMMLSIAIGSRVIAATYKGSVEHRVEIRNMSFQPNELDVRAGDTVTWINRDFVPHNVSPDDAGWRSPDMVKGDMFSLVVVGGFSYVCTLHRAVMAGTINVVDGN